MGVEPAPAVVGLAVKNLDIHDAHVARFSSNRSLKRPTASVSFRE